MYKMSTIFSTYLVLYPSKFMEIKLFVVSMHLQFKVCCFVYCAQFSLAKSKAALLEQSHRTFFSTGLAH
jgi:hypothetical protein